ncbi:FtsW/RodA/SpoVE family cell cycle protein [Candidatus Leptofilum sp.]|uniref:FtsW/RodA/SpoVE family cell cycle protein n=1 Tax=Candidatus Leptofilum sp. TaxID=3241576 RepID=UPI003B5BF989
MTTVNIVRKRSNRVNPVLRFRFDYWLLLSIAGLLVLGMLMVYSTTFDYGLRFQDDATYYFRRQFMALGLGFIALVGVMQFDYHILRRFSVPFLGATLAGLLFVLFFTAVSDLGAQRGLYNDSYQPSEIAKLAMIIYIAHWLSSKGDRIKLLTYGLLPFSVIVGVVCALIVRQPDLSTAGLIALVSFTLFFVAGADWRQFAVAGFLGGAVFLLLINTLPHAQARVDAYTQALSDPAQASWHVQQSLIALGRGGIFGVGLGESTQKFGPLPFAHTDGVFAILGEELGLAGTLLVVVLLGMFVWRGLRTAARARDSFGSLLAMGITCWIVYQAFINIAVITAVIPFTGIPLPFMSYGGTSLAITMVGAGILLNVSRDSALQKRPQGSGTRRKTTKRNTRRSRRPSADRF